MLSASAISPSLGAKELGGPRDEYDSYVNSVYELLATGASDNAIAEHLQQIVSDTMGLNGVRTEHMPTVAALREIPIPSERKIGDKSPFHSEPLNECNRLLTTVTSELPVTRPRLKCIVALSSAKDRGVT
jgi:hypothetical protein